MYYPWLDVPILTAPMLIAIAASISATILHFAVGGGILIARENSRALRDGDKAYREYVKRFLDFFFKSAIALGVISGIGAWFTIGVVSPLAAEILVKTFPFAIASGLCFLFLALVSGMTLYHHWDKHTPSASRITGWSLAVALVGVLITTTCVTSFMLNTAGLIKDWESTRSFWDAVLNVQFLPQLFARLGAALVISACFILLHAAVFENNAEIRERVTRRMVAPAFFGLFLTLVGVCGWLAFLPESGMATLVRASATNICAALFVGVIIALTALLIAGPVREPRETSVGTALALAIFSVVGAGVGEFMREAVRKPFVVDQVAFSAQITRADVSKAREEGLLYQGVWTNYLLDRLQEKEEYQALNISSERWLGRKTIHVVKQELPPREEPEEETEDLEENDETDAEEDAETLQGANRQYLGLTSVNYVVQTAALAQVPQNTRNNAPNNGSRFEPVQTAPARSAQTPSQAIPQTPQSQRQDVDRNAVAPAQFDRGGVPNAGQVTPLTADVAPTQDLDDEEDVEEEEEDEDAGKSPAELDEERYGLPADGNADLLKLSDADRLLLGRAVYFHHCSSCHAEKRGYSALAPIVAGRDQDELAQFALELNFTHHYMPPWAGTQVEAMLLAEFLTSIESRYPRNVFQKPKPRIVKEKKGTDKETEEETESEEVEETEL